MRCSCSFSIRAPVNFYVNIWAKSAADIASVIETVRGARRNTPMLARAHKAGTNIGALCEAIHQRQAEVGIRRIVGVLSLAKKYGCSACACAAALELRVPEYRFVRRYLERSPQAPRSLRQVDPFIRELIQYLDAIQQRFSKRTNFPS
jgi:hypothetical protein